LKRQEFLFGLVVVSLISAPLAASAHDWFDKWDHNHDHYWSWHDYYAARRGWEKEHAAEKRLSEAELREEYARLDADHNRRLSREEAATWGHW